MYPVPPIRTPWPFGQGDELEPGMSTSDTPRIAVIDAYKA
jgi:hypothetical protein